MREAGGEAHGGGDADEMRAVRYEMRREMREGDAGEECE